MDVSQSGYGDYGSDSGYGHQTYINCSSAIALFAFLGFLNILRDIVTMITAPAPAAERRKRDIDEEVEENRLDGITNFISNGGIDALYENLPEVVWPMMSGLMKSYDSTNPGECQAHHLCQANLELSKFGDVGGIIGHLLTNVMTGAFVRGHKEDISLAYASAHRGRKGDFCNVPKNCTVIH